MSTGKKLVVNHVGLVYFCGNVEINFPLAALVVCVWCFWLDILYPDVCPLEAKPLCSCLGKAICVSPEF